MAKKETPEEKLLRIIEETKKAPSGQVSSASAPAAVRRNSRLSFKMLQLN
ncbi:MAG: hypothetical protein GX606_07610 [Elusimicrobia bacterium]|nr:hypothetical protein [Elusimicrobiota bacterium]